MLENHEISDVVQQGAQHGKSLVGIIHRQNPLTVQSPEGSPRQRLIPGTYGIRIHHHRRCRRTPAALDDLQQPLNGTLEHRPGIAVRRGTLVLDTFRPRHADTGRRPTNA